MRDCFLRSRVRPTRTNLEERLVDLQWATIRITGLSTRRYGKGAGSTLFPHHPLTRRFAVNRMDGSVESARPSAKRTTSALGKDASHVEEVEHARGTGARHLDRRAGGGRVARFTKSERAVWRVTTALRVTCGYAARRLRSGECVFTRTRDTKTYCLRALCGQ